MNRVFASLICAVLCAAAPAFGEVGRWGIIVNEETKACALYWEGNSCMEVHPPEGWTPLLPAWDRERNALVLKYKNDVCLISSVRAEGCCKQFNLAWDAQFRAPQKKTGKENDPNSECYALPAPPVP